MLTGRPALPPGRIDWVDYAKGICIVMVVMMHSVLGVEAASGQTGFMHVLVAFAKPFRMPDFFLISGLFLAVVIDRDWRTYLDRKVVHFAYFYVLWVTIQFGFKAPSFAAESGWAHVGLMYLQSFIEPFGTLWFIYLLGGRADDSDFLERLFATRPGHAGQCEHGNCSSDALPSAG